MRVQGMLLERPDGACLPPGHERAREEERKWPRDIAGARQAKA